jgi:hypothetical protein
MKIGKLLCKKSSKGLIKDQFYEIESIKFIDDYEKEFGNWSELYTTELVSCYWVRLKGCYLSFSTKKILDFNYLYDYFESESEIRKHKLEKIYEIYL